MRKEYKYPNNIKRGKDSPNWKGGLYEVTNGYVYRYVDNHPFKNSGNYVPEHRIVMEKYLGRYLKPEEMVHHINGIKNDNRLENLKLFPSDKEHMRFHMSYYKKIKNLE